MKLIYFSDIRLDRFSPPAVNVLNMCQSFANNGIEITLYVPRINYDLRQVSKCYGLNVNFKIKNIYVPKLFLDKKIPGMVSLFSIFSIFKIKKEKYNAIYTRIHLLHTFMSYTSSKPCILELHQFRYQGQLRQAFYRILIKIASFKKNTILICISKSLAEQLNELKIPSNKIYVLHDGVNMNKYMYTNEKIKARKLLNIDNKEKIAMYTGSLITSKGINTILAVSEVLQDVSFYIIGGSEEDLKKYLINKTIPQNFKHIPHVDASLIPTYQQSADILLLLNNDGNYFDDVTSPLKLFEYMASRRPIIATKINSICEILRHNENALLVEVNDHVKVAENIEYLFMHPSKKKRITHCAIEEVTKYTWDNRAYLAKKIISEQYINQKYIN